MKRVEKWFFISVIMTIVGIMALAVEQLANYSVIILVFTLFALLSTILSDCMLNYIESDIKELLKKDKKKKSARPTKNKHSA